MNALTDVFADVFRARDGDATLAGLEILAAALAVALIALAVTAVACWRWRRQEKEQERRLELNEQRAALNRERLEQLASDDDKMAAVINGVLERVLPDPQPERRRHLRAVP